MGRPSTLTQRTLGAGLNVLTTMFVGPRDYQKDYEELADEIKEGLKVHFVESYEEIYDVAFKK